jgi:hypothetical protein
VADVAIIRWEYAGQPVEEYVFLPSAFGAIDKEIASAVGEGTFDLLDHVSAKYGTVILAPGNLTDKDGQMEAAGKTASQAIAQASGQMEMSWQSVGTSVYLIK